MGLIYSLVAVIRSHLPLRRSIATSMFRRVNTAYLPFHYQQDSNRRSRSRTLKSKGAISQRPTTTQPDRSCTSWCHFSLPLVELLLSREHVQKTKILFLGRVYASIVSTDSASDNRIRICSYFPCYSIRLLWLSVNQRSAFIEKPTAISITPRLNQSGVTLPRFHLLPTPCHSVNFC